MPKAKARHILVNSKTECEEIIKKLESGADFAELAAEHSQCPSGAQEGGGLGQFSPGQMVKEFDDIVFSGDLNKIYGPIKTQFGFHVIETTERTD